LKVTTSTRFACGEEAARSSPDSSELGRGSQVVCDPLDSQCLGFTNISRAIVLLVPSPARLFKSSRGPAGCRWAFDHRSEELTDGGVLSKAVDR
jgi:hypothetical protein